MGEIHYNKAEELATISTVFAVDGVATDPTTTTFVVTSPDGSSTPYTGGALTHPGPGEYRLDVSCASTTPGVWTAVLVGTGAAADVDVVTWTTYGVDLGSLYCTPAELKSRSGISPDDKLDDLEILGACLAATQLINDHCDRTFNRVAGVRTIEATCGQNLDLSDLVSVTAVSTSLSGDGVYGTAWSTTDYQLMPYDAPWRNGEPWPYTALRTAGSLEFPYNRCPDAPWPGRIDRVQIDGVWGWPRVPVAVKHAAAIWAKDLLKLGPMAFGVQGYGDYGPVRARPNPIADKLLERYVRNAAMVA